jgi:hypothetical protein
MKVRQAKKVIVGCTRHRYRYRTARAALLAMWRPLVDLVTRIPEKNLDAIVRELQRASWTPEARRLARRVRRWRRWLRRMGYSQSDVDHLTLREYPQK